MKLERLARVVVMGGLALGGCGRAGGPATITAAAEAERGRVLRFWERLNAATAARIGHDCAKARDLYREALDLDPKHEDCLYYLGQCQRQLQQPAQARAAFERLVEINPASARGHLALGALLASPDVGEAMDLAEAERHLRRAHEINGEETGAMVRLGEVLMLEGEMGEARRWLESALGTNPRSVEAAFLLGYLDWEGGDEKAALRLAQRAREAATSQAPVKGVLSEGDRKDPKFVAAPPLESPMGRMLFGDLAAFVRRAAQPGGSASDAGFVAAWRSVRDMRREYTTHRMTASSLAAQPGLRR
jgi:tetratricopeptide (TPR) repeat protein